MAKLLCKMAVKDGYFKKRIGVVCPNFNCERIIKSYDITITDKGKIKYDTCELMGEEHFKFYLKRLGKIEFYQISK